MSWIEPPRCPLCGAEIRICPTNYDRWVGLALVELPAKEVPERYRWRLTPLRGPSRVTTDVVAVRVRGVDPLPGDLVVPVHRMLCFPHEEIAEAEPRGAGDQRAPRGRSTEE
ncbi:DUF6083 domain-containing protein [Streptomyces sp. Q6]|uniref:DUF6083 domain-containing protein n=1 Tax=Streptomyces citrinus TaxID=3118173 RepID=A0ACD5AHE1_9ACTN